MSDPVERSDGSISPISGRFVNGETEAVFRRETCREWVGRIRLVALLGAVFYVAGGWLDWLNVGLDARMWHLFAIRLAVFASLVGIAVAVGRSSRYHAWLDHLVVAVMVVVAVGTTLIMALSPRHSTAHTVTVLAIVLLFYCLVPVEAIRAAVPALVLSAGLWLLALTSFRLSVHDLAVVTFYLVVVNSLGFFVSRTLNRSRRREYLTLRAERTAHDEVRREIDARLKAEQALTESEIRYRTLVELSPYAIVVHRHGEILYVNSSGVRLMGGERSEELVGHSVLEYLLPEFRDQAAARMRWLEQNGERLDRMGGQVPSMKAEVRCLDGRVVPCEVMSGRTMFGGEPAVQSVIADVTERKKLEEELRRLATTDPLTGAVNRRRFFELFAVEWSRARRHQRPLSVLMLDIDRFKSINDGWGHHVGDAALVSVVEACSGLLRAETVLGRMGGDEFAVLLPEVGAEGAAVVAERLRARIAGLRVDAEKDPVALTVSIGIATCDLRRGSPDVCLQAADDALLAAKRTGRNLVRAG